MSVKELKEELQLSGTDTLNVFFASNSVREELAGAATWPWAKEALTHQGMDVKVISPHPLLLYPTLYLNLLSVLMLFLSFFVFLSIPSSLPYPLLSLLTMSKRDGEQLELVKIFPARCLFPLPIIRPLSTGKG